MGYDIKGGLSGGIQGAGALSGLGPWGAGAGFVGGALLGGFGGGGGGGGKSYAPDPAAFETPGMDDWMGSGTYWDQQTAQAIGSGNMARPDDHRMDWAMDDSWAARGRQERGLGLLERYATGQDSMARAAGKGAVEDAQRAIASQAASGPGGYSPALARAAMWAQSNAGQQVAGKVANAAAQEKLAAQQAYLQAVAAQRQGDIAQQGQLGNWWSQQVQGGATLEGIKQRYIAMGMADRQATQAAAMAYESLQTDKSQKDRQAAMAAAMQNQNNMAAGLGAFGQGWAAYQQGKYDDQWNAANRADPYARYSMAPPSWMTHGNEYNPALGGYSV